jgi:alkanesulfonate monooxygenase SsuD/methylene tetrahydromethanopterin reductase-like flavin-dependent oxidoreductase (luciferase family)
MLDQLSGGRLELGVGRGASPYELRNFGVDPENSRAFAVDSPLERDGFGLTAV